MLAKPEGYHLKCPHCGAGYNVVRVEAEPKSVDSRLASLSRGTPLRRREGSIALKYFLVNRPRLKRDWGRVRQPVTAR